VSRSRLAGSFGRAASEYDLGRPGWPAEVASLGGLAAGATVLDLGAGTGKLTRVLLGRFSRVYAVEPDAEMRALLPHGCEALPGSAEAIPLDGETVDAIFCAEAFHWFDWPVALEEIARVLRPGGLLAILFNVPAGLTEPPFPEEARRVVERYRQPGVEAGGAIIASGAWREPFADSPFEELRSESFDHVHVRDTEGAIAETLSVSIFAGLSNDERAKLASELRTVLPDSTWSTALHAEAYWTRLRPADA
jgi:ubiquinone/menaquinone biosynthesis C-methylase UbiE